MQIRPQKKQINVRVAQDEIIANHEVNYIQSLSPRFIYHELQPVIKYFIHLNRLQPK
ncbi:unnamed protein product [Paramecium primaurelia]|uniref:Uncharacterized protein n=1 Tax=Paramecium primaurelia TaxID=5886 RepID=A0A8S1N9J5_PARPR|nr:unnamed protein product [Paramecium primaurelia]